MHEFQLQSLTGVVKADLPAEVWDTDPSAPRRLTVVTCGGPVKETSRGLQYRGQRRGCVRARHGRRGRLVKRAVWPMLAVLASGGLGLWLTRDLVQAALWLAMFWLIAGTSRAAVVWLAAELLEGR